MIFARTDKALSRLSAMFREGGVRKPYWAMVAERPPRDSDTLTHWLRRNPQQNKSWIVTGQMNDAQEARLSYRLLASLEHYHLLEIDLHTGRHHQIRAQLAAIGCHIKGDLKYGAARSNPGGGIHLPARAVTFEHPVKKTSLTLTADPPPDPLWDAALQALKSPRGAG